MAITNNDLKLMRAERNTDNADGGGMMTGTALDPSNINNLWDDVDSTELARGGVSIRRFFPAVRTGNTDKLLGARCAIIQDADADNVSTLLFQSDDHYALRSEIQAEIGSYVVVGTQSPLRPVGTQREGQNALVLYADKATDAPGVGEVIILESETGDRQFVKISDLETSVASYTYQQDGAFKKYRAVQFVVSISQALSQNFEGHDPSPGANHPTKILTTQSSDTARYYGIRPLATPVSSGDSAITVTDIQAPLVPVANSEVPMVDQIPGIETEMVQPTGEALSFSLGYHSGQTTLTLPVGWVPGTLIITIGSSQYQDHGHTLQLTSGTERLLSSNLNAGSGRLDLELSSSHSINVLLMPGSSVTLSPFTQMVEITAANRQLTYTEQLSPIPAPGSLRVEFLYLGEWYEIRDDGTGSLLGDGATGNLNIDTGSLSVVLPGEPDENSSLLYTWTTEVYSATTDDALSGHLALELSHDPEPGTVVVQWERNGHSYQLTEQPDGTFTGNGSADYNQASLRLQPSILPDGPVTVSGQYLGGERSIVAQSVPETQNEPVTLHTAAGVIPASIRFSAWVNVSIMNEADGQIIETQKRWHQRFFGQSDGHSIYIPVKKHVQIVGTVDSNTGDITLDMSSMTRWVDEWIRTGLNLTKRRTERPIRLEAQSLDIEHRLTASSVAFSETHSLSDIMLRYQLTQHLLPGAQLLQVSGNRQMVDDGDGTLFQSWNAETATGLQAGQINYETGEVELDYPMIQAQLSDLSGALLAGAACDNAAVPVNRVVFRTAGAPLKPAGVVINARRTTDTALASITAGGDGSVSGTFDASNTETDIQQPGTNYRIPVLHRSTSSGSVSGSVDFQTGVVALNFSQSVLLPTLRYSAVAYTNVPVDPTLLGLDPVKLPSNGKVPVFKPGYLVLIHHTGTITETSPLAGQVIDCGRTELAVVRITDAAGTSLASTQYVTDLEAGTVTLAAPFSAIDADGNSLTTPLTISHRVQDLCAVAGVRIDGHIQLMTQLTHDYPEGSLCSAVIEFGDLQARIENLFEQQIDVGGVFRDVLEGNPSVAQYDALAYPLEVDNQSAVQERWKLLFRSNSTYSVIGEQRGIIVESHAKDTDCSPINPFTGQPYFTIRTGGFGSGWVTGNVIRFNTVAAAAPVEAIRTTLPSHQRLPDQSVMIEFMGDAD